ncbi:MAG: cysteine desulfurase family protein [Planctomycetia bacterium]|nr:cysteine desulfurase family protein [Planctomycetia bacterium]
MIYLDNNATTQIAPEVLSVMQPCLENLYGNPSSVHQAGQEARHAIEESRYQVAEFIGCRPTEIIFTSGGTESDNAALMGTLAGRMEKKTIITSKVEHSAVRETVDDLAKHGYRVIDIEVNTRGQLDRSALRAALADADAALLSLIWANNETGVIFDIDTIGAEAREHRVPFHVDAVQAAGKIPLHFSNRPIDLLSISAHKFHGPKGIGALVVRRGVPFNPLIHGGPQERDRRGGTENVPGIVGMGAAAARMLAKLADPGYLERIATLRDKLQSGILTSVPESFVIGDGSNRVANTANIGFASLEAEAILILLNQHDICASAGAACSSGSLEPSRVLKAMGVPEKIAHGAVRFSLSEFTTEADIDQVLRVIPRVITRLREVLPV